MAKNTGRGSRVGKETPYFRQMKLRGGELIPINRKRPWWRKLLEMFR